MAGRPNGANCEMHLNPCPSCTANVGDAIAVALAAAGQCVIVVGGKSPCETDYLAACGMRFPDVPTAELERFNRETLREDMDESLEHLRYAKIARFFRRRPA